jgi:hypothetical protein
MPTRRIALAQLLLSGCAVMFGVCVLIEHAQAQSIQSRYCASSALHADHAFDANHNAFNAKHRSKW